MARGLPLAVPQFVETGSKEPGPRPVRMRRWSLLEPDEGLLNRILGHMRITTVARQVAEEGVVVLSKRRFDIDLVSCHAFERIRTRSGPTASAWDS